MGKGYAITGFVLSIVGIVGSFVLFYISLPCSILGLIFSIIGGKKLKANNLPSGIATAGLVVSIVSLSLAVLMTACGICAIIAAAELAGEIAGKLVCTLI